MGVGGGGRGYRRGRKCRGIYRFQMPAAMWDWAGLLRNIAEVNRQGWLCSYDSQDILYSSILTSYILYYSDKLDLLYHFDV